MPSSACTPSPLPPFPTRRSSDLDEVPLGFAPLADEAVELGLALLLNLVVAWHVAEGFVRRQVVHTRLVEIDMHQIGQSLEQAFLRSEEHTSELQSLTNLVCRLLLAPPHPSPLSLHDALPISTRFPWASRPWPTRR